MSKIQRFHKISKAQLERAPTIFWVGAYALMTLFFILFGGLAVMSDLKGLNIIETVKSLVFVWVIFHIIFILLPYIGCLLFYFLLGEEKYKGRLVI